MSDTNVVIRRLGDLFAETFHIEAPPPDIDLLDTGILDSFQFVELLYQLERQFDFRVKIDDIDLDDIRTLARIARLVAANGGAADSSAALQSSRPAD